MSDERQPIRDGYDAIVDMLPGDRAHPQAYALLKRTYRISDGHCLLADPEPLLHDLRQEDASPRLVPGTDFWPRKDATDFVVQGSAYAPGGKPVSEMSVSVEVDGILKRVIVFGDRPVRWTGGLHPRIGAPEPFTEMPLTWKNAYGGIDFRVEVPASNEPGLEIDLAFDHPGLYPRNPFGKGYLVESGEVPDMMMPNLENPNDLLRVDRLIARDPELWYRQPLPWCYDWMHPITFPRIVYFGDGADAWYPGPQDERMPEVALGFLERGYRDRLVQDDIIVGPDLRWLQAASHGFTLAQLRPGATVRIEGMHPERRMIEFALPREIPRMVFDIDGTYVQSRPRLHHVVCRPADLKLTLVYGARAAMPRAFIPGIHKHIPLSVRIDDDVPVVYQAPPTVKERIEEAKRERAEKDATRNGEY